MSNGHPGHADCRFEGLRAAAFTVVDGAQATLDRCSFQSVTDPLPDTQKTRGVVVARRGSQIKLEDCIFLNITGWPSLSPASKDAVIFADGPVVEDVDTRALGQVRPLAQAGPTFPTADDAAFVALHQVRLFRHGMRTSMSTG